MSVTRIRKEVPDEQVGDSWESGAQLDPGSSRADVQRAQIERLQHEMRGLFGALVRKAGGVDWLVAMLDQRPSYESKVTEAIHGSGERKIQWEWLAPLLTDAAAAELLLSWLSDKLGYEPPVRQRVVSQEDVDRATTEVVGELLNGPLKDTVRDAVAKKLGVRPEDVKL